MAAVRVNSAQQTLIGSMHRNINGASSFVSCADFYHHSLNPEEALTSGGSCLTSRLRRPMQLHDNGIIFTRKYHHRLLCLHVAAC
ncbi:hypothetical protein M514_15522 [Trichuris suis]|uniref:Uncharacterized protein n=1 Tax=Trichuris suis TaxID=68888 RepID=A0A085NS03_9BILA|nr:hypothetical protein M514_15522 [Trichuris suis]